VRLLEIEVGEPADLCVLVRNEDEEDVVRGREFPVDTPGLLTSYPNLADRLVRPVLQRLTGRPLLIREARGQVEAILRNRDYKDAVFALDVVRSGETARSYGLRVLGRPLLTSRPQLFIRNRLRGFGGDRFMNESFLRFMREKLEEADIGCRGTFDALQPWNVAPFSPPSLPSEVLQGFNGCVFSVEVLESLRSVIGDQNVEAGKSLLADGGKMWVFQSPEAIEGNPDLDESEKAFCRKRFEAGELWVGISRSPKPDRPTAAQILMGVPAAGYDTHGNYRGGGGDGGVGPRH
jgi:hypothetical protein